jgi:N-methylhydantoinase A
VCAETTDQQFIGADRMPTDRLSSDYRIAVDTGGTFTDVVVADEQGRLTFNKALTTPDRMFEAAQEALALVADELGLPLDELLRRSSLFVYGTTRATNAILEGKTARTAFFTTEGFPDILTFREGGRTNPFDFDRPYPEPYIPRRLTFEVPERIDAQGEVRRPLDTERVRALLRDARDAGAEAIAVCLVWSIANPEHERAIGELIKADHPGLPYTLSHELNPIIREYRRASSTAIDASLKPLMQGHLRETADDLRAGGFAGELLVVTSSGGCSQLDDVVSQPIYSVDSGPSMAPVAALAYAVAEGFEADLIVCDAGGTSFDVSLIQNGRIATTSERWLGPLYQGHITGLSAVAVESIGAGGGSIAWIDSGGMLQIGPESAGAAPGPVCYGRGGTRPTVTDAAAVLGYFDADHFLGGRLRLDIDAAAEALGAAIAEPLGLSLERAASAVLIVAEEAMVAAIRDVTIGKGVDPRRCVMVAGGGAGGLNAVAIARALGCRHVLVPAAAGALSACGAQFADIVADFSISRLTNTAQFAYAHANEALGEVRMRMDRFAAGLRSGAALERTFSVEARYAYQAWDLEVPLQGDSFAGPDDVAELEERFHEVHERVFAVRETDTPIDCQQWKGRLTARFAKPQIAGRAAAPTNGGAATRRSYFEGIGAVDLACHVGATLRLGETVEGPAVLEEATTTIVVPPGACARVTTLRNYLIETGA